MRETIVVIKRLFKYLNPYKLQFTIALLSSFIWVITNALLPYFLGLITTTITNSLIQTHQIDMQALLKVVAIFAGMNLLSIVMQYTANATMTLAVQKSMHDLRKDITNKLNRLPVSFFDRHQQGDLLSRVTNDVDAVSNALQQGFISLISSVLTLITITIIIFILNVKLALIIVILVPATFILIKVLVKYSQPYFKKQQDSLGAMNAFVQESMSGFNVIKLYGQEENMEERFSNVNSKLMHYGFIAQMLSGIMMPLINLLTYLTYIAVGTVGSLLCFQGALTVGDVQAFIQYVWSINQPLSQVSQLSSIFQGASAGLKRIFALLDEPEENNDYSIDVPSDIKGEVQFDHVDFGYYKKQLLIKDLNLDVKAGQTIAIVGPTGAGKTTLVNLLMRFYDIVNGEIKIDGLPTNKMARQKMRTLFGMVLQDTWLFEGTIMDNLRFGKLEATDEEVIAAAKSANIDEYIQALPDGYQTKISAESQQLSQGQMQLLTIARAILSDPKILILDEATSSVDTRIEMQIQEAMDRVMKNRTSFVIAHRLSTIRDADLIMVMDHGDVVELGNHEELMARNGVYAEIYNSQF